MIYFRRLLLIAVINLTIFSAFARGEKSLRDLIDQRVEDAWNKNNITPAKMSSDAEFLRRVYLDMLGTIPSYSEAVAFVDDPSPDKRDKLIDDLLEHSRFGLHQADVWDMVYFGRKPPGHGTSERGGFKKWLRTQFTDNVRYDVWAKQILRADGNTVEHGAPMFFVQYKNQPEDAAEAVARRFLGVQLQCARCHDHPFDSWSQEEFYGFAAFLARMKVVEVGKKEKLTAYAIGETEFGDVKFTGAVADQMVGDEGVPVKPRFLAGDLLAEPETSSTGGKPKDWPKGKMPPKPKFSRKDALADWVTGRDNPYFARAAANRVWAQFMGKGIVDPVDNLSDDNPPSHPELLDALADGLVQHDFDLKWLIREIVNSRTYQLASNGPVTSAKPRWFERARYRPLSAEELLESWAIAAGQDEVLKSRGYKQKDRFDYRITWDYLRKSFGEPNDGSGDFQGGLGEHLYLNNGQVTELISRESGGLHNAISKSEVAWEDRVERIFLQILSRRPTEAETEKFVAHLAADGDADDRLREAIWVLMTCSEFRFNH